MKTRKKNKTIEERLDRIDPYVYYMVYRVADERVFGEGTDSWVYPKICPNYGRFPSFLRFTMDETGIEFVSKNERGWVDKGSVDITFAGDALDVSKRQFSTINSYRMVQPTEAGGALGNYKLNGTMDH